MKKGLISILTVLAMLVSFTPGVSAAPATVPLLSYDEALQYMDFTDAITDWVNLYQCTRAEAEERVINGTDDNLIIRLGTCAKDHNSTAHISMSFRPSSYQEMLAGRNGGVWNPSLCSETKTLAQNLAAWTDINEGCALPGQSNHNTGAAADVDSSWLRSMTETEVNAYSLTKNVANEPWHVVVIELAAIDGLDRVQYAINHGLEPVYVPCRDTYVSDYYIQKGAYVAEVQKRLKALGYNPGTVDGIFGSGTKQAVTDFQSANGLTADGICGRDTLDALFGTPTPPPPVTDIQITSSAISPASIPTTGTVTCTVKTNVRAAGVSAVLDGNGPKPMDADAAGTTWTCTYDGFTRTGARTVTFTATGSNGSVATDSKSFTVTPAPNIQITSATLSAPSLPKVGIQTCTVKTNVRAAGVTAQLNGNAAKAMTPDAAGTTWTCTYSGFTTSGTRSITFKATGTNGSIDTEVRSFTVWP